jgi:hypothetical protein
VFLLVQTTRGVSDEMKEDTRIHLIADEQTKKLLRQLIKEETTEQIRIKYHYLFDKELRRIFHEQAQIVMESKIETLDIHEEIKEIMSSWIAQQLIPIIEKSYNMVEEKFRKKMVQSLKDISNLKTSTISEIKHNLPNITSNSQFLEDFPEYNKFITNQQTASIEHKELSESVKERTK